MLLDAVSLQKEKNRLRRFQVFHTRPPPFSPCVAAACYKMKHNHDQPSRDCEGEGESPVLATPVTAAPPPAAAAADAAAAAEERKDLEPSSPSFPPSSSSVAAGSKLDNTQRASFSGRQGGAGGSGDGDGDGRGQPEQEEGGGRGGEAEEGWEMVVDAEVPETCCGFARLTEGGEGVSRSSQVCNEKLCLFFMCVWCLLPG